MYLLTQITYKHEKRLMHSILQKIINKHFLNIIIAKKNYTNGLDSNNLCHILIISKSHLNKEFPQN